MTPEEIQSLAEAWLDGSIGEADARRLAEAMRSDPAAADQVRRALEFAGLAGQALEPADDEAFLRSFRERVSAERQPTEFIKALERRASARRSARFVKPGPSRAWVASVAAAAAVLLAVVAALSLGGRRERPEPIVHVEPAPVTPAPVLPAPQDPVPPSRTQRDPEPLRVPPPAPMPPKAPEPEEPPKPPAARPPAVAPAPPAPVPAPAPRTIAGVAQVQVLEGQAWVTQEGRRLKDRSVPPGGGVATAGSSRAAVLLPDGTRLTLEPDTIVSEIQRGPKGTRVHLERGSLTGDVEKQAADQPLVFVTAHAEARVLGTVLRLGIEAGATRLEVRQGRVRLSRDGRSVDVASGQYATAGPQGFVPPRPLHPEEIVLLPQDARLVGAEWTLQRDLKSSSGWALEAGTSVSKPWDPVEERLSYVMFTFHASAEREYRLWVRTTSMERGDAWLRDQLVVEPVNAKLSRRCEKFGSAPTSAYVFTGVAAAQAGYSWLSGHGEAWKVDDAPITVRFKETGMQTLRLFVGHPSVRVDSVWLSATQKQRPPAKLLPPAVR